MDIAYTLALGNLVGEDIVVNITRYDGFRAVNVYNCTFPQWNVQFDIPGEGIPSPEEVVPYIQRERANRETRLESLRAQGIDPFATQ